MTHLRMRSEWLLRNRNALTIALSARSARAECFPDSRSLCRVCELLPANGHVESLAHMGLRQRSLKLEKGGCGLPYTGTRTP